MKNIPAQGWRYEFKDGDEETKYIYALSEKDARKLFKKFFKREAGELLDRRPW